MSIGKLVGGTYCEEVLLAGFPAAFVPPVRYFVAKSGGTVTVKTPLQSTGQDMTVVGGATYVGEFTEIDSADVTGVTVFR